MTDKIQACSSNSRLATDAPANNTKKEPTPEEIKLFDFNGNRKIDSDNEINAYNNFTTARDNAKLELKFDIDGDGKLNYPEKVALNAYKKEKADLDKVAKDIEECEKLNAENSNSYTVDNKTKEEDLTVKNTDVTNELDSINNKISKLEPEPVPEPEPWITNPWL